MERTEDGRESSETPDQALRQSIDVQQKALSRPVPCPPHRQTAIPAMRLKRHCFIASWPELAGSHPVSSGRHGTHTKSRRDTRCRLHRRQHPQAKSSSPGAPWQDAPAACPPVFTARGATKGDLCLATAIIRRCPSHLAPSRQAAKVRLRQPSIFSAASAPSA